MTTISAKTVLRSRNASRPEKVLSTLLLRYPRWIHAEFMTHRVFSRNAASSRAIPVKKMIADIRADPAVPLFWGSNQKGMQAGEECNASVVMESTICGDQVSFSRENAWLEAMEHALNAAEGFAAAGYHKQIVNRLLEPFMHLTVLVSATEWENFLELRDHHAAEPHIQMLAREIKACLDNDPIDVLEPGEWHLPFIENADGEAAVKFVVQSGVEGSRRRLVEELLRKLSVARCASTSYKTVDGFDMTLEKASQLHDKFVNATPLHASPFEHVAMADEYIGRMDRRWRVEEHHGNFEGFRQLRFQL